MLGKAISIGRVLGIEIRLDTSWFIVFALVTWSLSGHYFPMAHPGWSSETYWSLGLVTSLLFFASVVGHELAHSLVARANGIQVRDITLFIFGGAAQLADEPRRARDEFVMALAGPAMSLGLAGIFGLLWQLGAGTDDGLHALAGWLASINLMLGLFNLIPGFPLDGGRVLRAAIWGLGGDLKRATLIATAVGRYVAFALILWGVWRVFSGDWAGGIWIAFIGWFLDSAATRSSQQLVLDDLLAGHTVAEVMWTDCPRVPRHLTLDALVEHTMLPSLRTCFPVVEVGEVVGLITLDQVRSVAREQWSTTRVGDVMVPLPQLEPVRPDEGLSGILERMTRDDLAQLPVMDGQRLVGLLSRSQLLNYVQTRAEFAGR